MNVVIFDTETIGKVSQDLLNVGYKIIDINIQKGTFETLQERDYLVGKLFNNKVYCINDDFVGAKKYNAYLGLLQDKHIIKRSISQIFKTLSNDLKRYGVLFGYAYNCNFDLDKFEKTAERNGLENPFNNLKVFDIWGYACKHICDTEEYKTWALDNDILTATKEYIATSVEAVTKFLNQDLEFIEDHTALSDTQWETRILVECVKRGCDITRDLKKFMIPSKKVLVDTIKVNGELQEISYTHKRTFKGITTYKE